MDQRSPVHEIVNDLLRALHALGSPVNTTEIEEWGFSIHAALSATLAQGGARIDAYYYCPHHPDGVVAGYAMPCRCRKPATGMLQDAARDLGLDLSRSWMVGDKWLDVECGAAAGARSLLVRTGMGAEQERAGSPGGAVRADAILNNLMEAAEWILLNSSR